MVVAAEPLLRRLTSAILRQQGFSVSEVSTMKAVEISLSDADSTVGLLMATFDNRDQDVVLSTVLRLQKQDARLKIILASAFSPSLEILGQINDAGIPFLSLPCSFARFSQLIASLDVSEESVRALREADAVDLPPHSSEAVISA